MARPAPDPERVVEAYELVTRGMSYREVGERYGIDPSTVGRWVKQASGWWQDVERLDRVTEYGVHRQTLGRVQNAIETAFAEGRIDVEVYAQWSLKILDRHARLTGVDSPTRVSVEATTDERPAPPPAAVRAIEDMRKRATTTERMVIEGEPA